MIWTLKIYRIYKHVHIHIIFITICIFALHKWIVISGVRVSHGNTVSVVGWFIVIAFDTSHVANCQCVITNSDLHNEINNLKTQCATFSFIYKANAPVVKLNVLCHLTWFDICHLKDFFLIKTSQSNVLVSKYLQWIILLRLNVEFVETRHFQAVNHCGCDH